MFGGLILTVCGLFWTWMLYGFGTMMDPDIQGPARETAIWREVWSDPTFPLGILMIVVGCWLMFRKPKRSA